MFAWIWKTISGLFDWGKHQPTTEGLRVWNNLSPIHKRNIQSYVSEGPYRPEDITVDKFTCCDCPLVTSCHYSYDMYNLHGDCLANK